MLLSRFKRLFYGWVVVGDLLIIGTIIWGIRFSFGVFFKSIENEFSLSRAATSGIFSLYLVFSSLICVLAGFAIDRYGPRIIMLLMAFLTGLSLLLTSQITSPWQLYITYSLLLSTGTAAMYIVLTSTVSRWFVKRRGFALGIAGSATGLGMVIMSPMATFLIDNLGWRDTYLVMGLIAWLLVIPLSRLLKKDPQEIGRLPDGVQFNVQKTTMLKSDVTKGKAPSDYRSLIWALKNGGFWIFSIIWLLTAFCHFFLLTHIVPHAIDMGIPAQDAAALLAFIGGIGIVGRLLVGRLSDKIGGKAAAILSSLITLGAVLWLIWADTLWMLYLFAIVYGFAFGGRATAVSVLIADTFGVRSLGAVLGLMELNWGIGAAIGSIVGGIVFDLTGSYLGAFQLGALAIFLVTLLLATVKRVER